MFAAFDRYAGVTDLAALNAFSERPLRKSIRINTLKWSPDDVQTYAQRKGWTLEQVPWCADAFFVERENREEGIGKDWHHLVGHF